MSKTQKWWNRIYGQGGDITYRNLDGYEVRPVFYDAGRINQRQRAWVVFDPAGNRISDEIRTLHEAKEITYTKP